MIQLLYVLIVIACVLVVRTLLRGAIYVPTSDAAIARMLLLAKPLPGERMVDLGAGDGRIVIAFAKAGTNADGYEHDPLLAWIARRNIAKADLQERAHIYTKDLWGAELGGYDIIIVFGASHIMGRLSRKLAQEAKPQARILTHLFPLPGWEPVAHADGVYFYVKSS